MRDVVHAQVLVTTTYFTLGQGCGNIFWHYGFTRAGETARGLYLAGAVLLMLNLAATARTWRTHFGYKRKRLSVQAEV